MTTYLPFRRPRGGLVAFCAIILGLAGAADAETISGKARVLDGDTLAVSGQRIRLDGIDAPEAHQTCRRNSRKWACGKAATQAMRNLVGRNMVHCEVSRRDRYGRAIGTCHVRGQDLQQQLVRQGLALAYRRYSNRYVPQENAARADGIGLWSGSFVEPWLWRKKRRKHARTAPGQPPQSPSSAACFIKGNISANGRIYHMPGGKYYERTGIDESSGERWFCSEAEARAAGWRRSRR
ncbi:MAG: thermonuclease family protein [Alphaproteobacteria bacterium]|nr:thermonuclease family protein [Alphaproteobacteria bacterium]